MGRIKYCCIKASVNNKKFNEMMDGLRGLVSIYEASGWVVIARHGVNKKALKEIHKRETGVC